MRVYTDGEFEAALAKERVRVIHAVLDEIDAFAKTSKSHAFYSPLHDRVVSLLITLAPAPDRPSPVKPDAGPSTE